MGIGKGSLEMRDSDGYIWRLVVCSGYSKGKKIRQKKTVHVEGRTFDSRKKAAERELSLFLSEVDHGNYLAPSRMTVSDFIDKWLSEHGANLENKTYYRYEGMLKGRITAAFGHLKLEQVKPLHLLDFYKNLQEPGIREDTLYKATPDFIEYIKTLKNTPAEIASICRVNCRTLTSILSGKPTNSAHRICTSLKLNFNKMFTPASELKPLSNKTIIHHHRLLSVMFADAVRWGLMKENPCTKVQPPRPEYKEMKCLDEEGVSRLLECLQEEPIKTQAMIITALVTGCRRGEVAALQWSAIDLNNKTINVKQAAAYTPVKGIIIKIPKTPSSIRKIAIPDSAVVILKQYRKWQMSQKLKVGDQWLKAAREEYEKAGEEFTDPAWVFTTWDGYNIHPDTLTDTFKKFLARHGLPKVRLHDIRHTACTMLLHAGLNVRAVAARMGHANPNVTLAVYAHALRSADQQAADLMESVIKGNDPQKALNS
jgi:integrase